MEKWKTNLTFIYIIFIISSEKIEIKKTQQKSLKKFDTNDY